MCLRLCCFWFDLVVSVFLIGLLSVISFRRRLVLDVVDVVVVVGLMGMISVMSCVSVSVLLSILLS